MKGKASELLSTLPFLILLAVGFCLYTYPVTDGDFFWHVGNGKWIVEHGELPESDPFTYTASDTNPLRPDSGRIPFLLQQYWLGQVAMYGIWQYGGYAGIILGRAVIYSFILIFLYLWMRKNHNGFMNFLLLFLVAHTLAAYPNERPQIFSFVFAPLLLFLLDAVPKTLEKNQASPATFAAAGIPVLMLVWGNTHGAYLLGIAFILMYVSAHIMETLFTKKNAIHFSYVFFLLFSASMSMLNPRGIQAFTEYINVNAQYAAIVHENVTVWTALTDYQEFFPAYWFFLLITVVTLMIHFKKIPLTHKMILSSLVFLSFSATRHMAYLLLAAPMVAQPWTRCKWNRTAMVASLVPLAFWITTADLSNAFTFGPSKQFPAGAVRFVEKTSPAPNIFNYYDWGGFLEWNLPEYQFFIDGRGLVEELVELHGIILEKEQGLYFLDRFQVNIVIIPGVSPYSGKIYSLPLILNQAPDWHLVYQDEIALIFLRGKQGNQKIIREYVLPESRLYEHFLARLAWIMGEKPNLEQGWLSMARAQLFLGQSTDASRSLEQVLRINPDNPGARSMRQRIHDY